MDGLVAATSTFTPLDGAALVILIVAFGLGLRSGFFPQLGGLFGAIVGGAFALLVLPLVRPALQTMEPGIRALIVLCGLIFSVGFGEAIGSMAGRSIRRSLGDGILGNLDRLAGALLGVAQGVLVLWLAGGILAAGTIPRLAAWAQSSWTVRELSLVLPPPTAIASNLGRLLDASGLPEVFVGLEPFPRGPVATPTTGEAGRIVASAVPSTIKVTAEACGYELSGTGFSIGRGYFVTNAHVVAGARDQQVVPEGGGSDEARVVLFDPSLDVAVLYAPDLTLPALEFAPEDPPTGTKAAALGHPLGEELTVIPVGVAGSYEAEGRDIYGSGRVTRDVLELSARIDKGDSGGPLILTDGAVGGVIFAEAKGDDAVGYALSPVEVAATVEPAVGKSSEVSTGACIR